MIPIQFLDTHSNAMPKNLHTKLFQDICERIFFVGSIYISICFCWQLLKIVYWYLKREILWTLKKNVPNILMAHLGNRFVASRSYMQCGQYALLKQKCIWQQILKNVFLLFQKNFQNNIWLNIFSNFNLKNYMWTSVGRCYRKKCCRHISFSASNQALEL